MTAALEAARRHHARVFGAGLAMLFAAALSLPSALLVQQRTGRDPTGALADALVGAVGTCLALVSVGPLVRAAARLRQWHQVFAGEDFARATLPSRIYLLLQAVAGAGEPASPRRRAAVGEFLRSRMADRITPQDLGYWERHAGSADPERLARAIRSHLVGHERDTIYIWCCQVALAGGPLRAAERSILDRIARGFGLSADRIAQLERMAAERGAAAGRGPAPEAEPWPPAASEPRAHALRILGLRSDASREAIRRRHRELVKRYHPDAQPNLGPVAREEATERFRAIQRAYETLTA